MFSGLVFFYCTIPFILMALSLYETIQHRRKIGIRPILATAFSILGLIAWLIQFGLQGRCILPTSRFNSTKAEAGWCAFELRQWDRRSYWSSGLGVAYYVTWLILFMFPL